jgi:translation initiation factor 2 subunit 2
MENYEKLLEKAYEKVKLIENTGERFEVPGIKGHFQGKRTVLTNFREIATHLRRTPEHLQKFLLKELAAKGNLEGERLVLNSKISSKKINPKIEQYVNEFVLCRECQKPDTELDKDGKMTIIRCLACGAKHPVRTKI